MSTSSGPCSGLNSPSSDPLSPLSSPVVVEGDARFDPIKRRADFFGMAPFGSFFLDNCCTRGFLIMVAFLTGLGPTLPARAAPGVVGFGVPGPREEWRTVLTV